MNSLMNPQKMTMEKEFEEWVIYNKLENGDIFTWKYNGNEYRDEVMLMLDSTMQRIGQCLQLTLDPRLTWFYNDGKALFLVIDHIDLSALQIESIEL